MDGKECKGKHADEGDDGPLPDDGKFIDLEFPP